MEVSTRKLRKNLPHRQISRKIPENRSITCSMRILSFISTVYGMHLIGTAVLFGIVSGPMAILAAPILGIFGWFIAFPEAMMLGLMRLFYDPPLKRRAWFFQGLCWVLVCGVLASLLIPKEKNSEVLFYVAGFLAGAGAGAFAFTITHIQKRFEQNSRTNPRNSGPLR